MSQELWLYVWIVEVIIIIIYNMWNYKQAIDRNMSMFVMVARGAFFALMIVAWDITVYNIYEAIINNDFVARILFSFAFVASVLVTYVFIKIIKLPKYWEPQMI